MPAGFTTGAWTERAAKPATQPAAGLQRRHYTVEASFSEESRQHIERFYAERVDLDRRAATLLNRDHVDVSDWIGTCMVNGTPVEELDEYQLIAHGLGSSLALTSMPVVLGRAALEELANGLSERTLGETRRFRDEYLDLPPELKELLKDTCFV